MTSHVISYTSIHNYMFVLLQDERNQVISTNVWLDQVGVKYIWDEHL